jgi:hypothetical protein
MAFIIYLRLNKAGCDWPRTGKPAPAKSWACGSRRPLVLNRRFARCACRSVAAHIVPLGPIAVGDEPENAPGENLDYYSSQHRLTRDFRRFSSGGPNGCLPTGCIRRLYCKKLTKTGRNDFMVEIARVWYRCDSQVHHSYPCSEIPCLAGEIARLRLVFDRARGGTTQNDEAKRRDAGSSLR